MDLHLTQIGFQMVVFFAAMAVLNFFVFKPLLHIHKLRQQQTDDREKEASSIVERAQVMVQRYDQSIAEMRSEADRKIGAAVSEASQQSKEILARARVEGQEIFTRKKQTVMAERQKTQSEMKNQVENLADELLGTVLH